MVRYGFLPARGILTGIGPFTVMYSNGRSREVDSVIFRPAMVPLYVRKLRSLEAALPRLCLKGISTVEIEEALKVLGSSPVQGLSASTISRLKTEWSEQYQQ